MEYLGIAQRVTQFLCAANYSGQSARALAKASKERDVDPFCIDFVARRLALKEKKHFAPWRCNYDRCAGSPDRRGTEALFVNDIDLFIASTLLVSASIIITSLRAEEFE